MNDSKTIYQQQPTELRYVSRRKGLTPVADFSDRMVVFVHVPKAAGTNLDHFMAYMSEATGEPRIRVSGHPLGQRMSADSPDASTSFSKLKKTDLHSLRYLTGHIPYGVHEGFARRPLYMTMLREPIDRYVSHFFMGVSRGAWPADADIGALFERGAFVADAMTRQIAGHWRGDLPCDDATLAEACDNLDNKFDVVGFADRAEETFQAVIALLNWPDIAYEIHQFGVARPSEVPNRVRNAFKPFAHLDQQLYEHARHRPTPCADGLLHGLSILPPSHQFADKVLLALIRLRSGDDPVPFRIIEKSLFERETAALAAHGVSLKRFE